MRTCLFLAAVAALAAPRPTLAQDGPRGGGYRLLDDDEDDDPRPRLDPGRDGFRLHAEGRERDDRGGEERHVFRSGGRARRLRDGDDRDDEGRRDKERQVFRLRVRGGEDDGPRAFERERGERDEPRFLGQPRVERDGHDREAPRLFRFRALGHEPGRGRDLEGPRLFRFSQREDAGPRALVGRLLRLLHRLREEGRAIPRDLDGPPPLRLRVRGDDFEEGPRKRRSGTRPFEGPRVFRFRTEGPDGPPPPRLRVRVEGPDDLEGPRVLRFRARAEGRDFDEPRVLELQPLRGDERGPRHLLVRPAPDRDERDFGRERFERPERHRQRWSRSDDEDDGGESVGQRPD
ncbi:MAG TPA: hypothetical protein VFF73_33285 [Planctomycetota bacterium]|nr:hypothetical protein [Planctomycetota bacterium]